MCTDDHAKNNDQLKEAWHRLPVVGDQQQCCEADQERRHTHEGENGTRPLALRDLGPRLIEVQDARRLVLGQNTLAVPEIQLIGQPCALFVRDDAFCHGFSCRCQTGLALAGGQLGFWPGRTKLLCRYSRVIIPRVAVFKP